MDEIDLALTEAWARVAPRVRADRVEAFRRSMRRARPVLTRPARAWCLCIRASDTRLARHAYVPKGYAEHHEPHAIIVTSESIRELCKPVFIPWPGVDWEHAGQMLGRKYTGLSAWIRRGALQVRRQHPQPAGKMGKPVPFVWSNGALDPSANLGEPPEAVWGTMWQHLWRRVPDGLEFELRRVPLSQQYRRDPPGRRRHRGWQFVCPGLRQSSKAANSQSSKSEEVASGTIEEMESGGCSTESGACGRTADRLYLPLRAWTMLDALGLEDPLEVTVLARRDEETERRRDGEKWRSGKVAEWQSEGDARRGPLPAVRAGGAYAFTPACHRCHRVRFVSHLDHGWNAFVAYLSAGLLYGHEVKRPRSAEGRRKRRFAPKFRGNPRDDRVLPLLLRGLSPRRIGARLGMTERLATLNVDAIYRRYGVGGRAALCAKLGVPFARAMTVRQEQVAAGLREGLGREEISARLGLSLDTVGWHIGRLCRRLGVRGESELCARLRAIELDDGSAVGPRPVLKAAG